MYQLPKEELELERKMKRTELENDFVEGNSETQKIRRDKMGMVFRF